MSCKYRIYCNVHGWQYTWAETPMTECPIESSDSVIANTLCCVGKEVQAFEITPYRTKMNVKEFGRAASAMFDPEIHGELRRVKILSRMEEGMTSYEVEVFDRTNHTSLVTNTFTNDVDMELKDIGLISTPPLGKVNLEINVKRNGGSSSHKTRIGQIVFYVGSQNS